jgi:hypothetical protein
MFLWKTVGMLAPSSSSPAICYLPAEGHPRRAKNPSYRIGPDDLLFNLVFFSTFEELVLPIQGPMEDAGVIKLYDPFPSPCLYVAPVANVLGRVPLMPLFLAGNSAPTIPHKFSKHKGSGFPLGSAGTADADGRRGSNVYEVNTWLSWLWMFGRGKPRLGGLFVEETALRKSVARVEQVKRAVETRRRRRAAKESSIEMKCVCG